MSSKTILSGNWRSFYRYPSSGRGGDEFWGRHVMIARQSGSSIHLESVPESKSHVIIDLEVDDAGQATGTWREETELDGYYKGAIYEGTIELKVSEDGQRMSGIWHGEGSDGEMNTDVWELTKEGIEQPTE